MNHPSSTDTEAGAIAQLAREGQLPIIDSKTLAVPVLLWPKSERRESLEQFLARPIRKRAKVTVRDHESFVHYVTAHRELGTHLFQDVNEQGGSFTAIIDYHHTLEAAWADHVCVYTCEHTPEWKRWMEKSDESLSQTDLALFIEDNLVDIIDPEGARMLELVKTLEATATAEFRSQIRLQNGDRQFHYAHTTNAKAGQQGDLEIPERFTLSLPVFQNGPAYTVPCRFRYVLRNGTLVVGYEIERPHKIIELALAQERTAITQLLNLPVHFGSVNVPKV